MLPGWWMVVLRPNVASMVVVASILNISSIFSGEWGMLLSSHQVMRESHFPAELIAAQPLLKEVAAQMNIPMSELQRIGSNVVSLKVAARGWVIIQYLLRATTRVAPTEKSWNSLFCVWHILLRNHFL